MEEHIQIAIPTFSLNPFSSSSMEGQSDFHNEDSPKPTLKLPKKCSFSESVERERKFSSFSAKSLDFLLPNNNPAGDIIAFSLNKSKSKRVIVNVGGEKNEILWSTLERFPETRLGKLKFCMTLGELLDICDDYFMENNEYFFDRNPKAFSVILNFYRVGKLHIPHETCVVEFSHEMDYWGISELNLDTCCHLKFQQKKDQLYYESHMRKSVSSAGGTNSEQSDELYEFGDGLFSKYRKIIWDLFERPDYKPAKVMSAIVVFFIILSVSTFTLSTMEEFQDISCKHLNKTLCAYEIAALTEAGMDTPAFRKEFVITKSYLLVQIEQVSMIFFTVEYILRFIACPNKKRFLRSWHNIIDLVAVLPYYLSQILILVDIPIKQLQILIIFRVLRVFKLARHSNGLQSLGYTFKRCYHDLGVLLLFLSVGVMIFSSLIYFAEKEVNSKFKSIPSAFWWSVITMTTVGYGDSTPVTVLGKIIGMATAVSGIIFCALPIAFTMNTFGEFYEKQRQRDKLLRRRKSLMWIRH